MICARPRIGESTRPLTLALRGRRPGRIASIEAGGCYPTRAPLRALLRGIARRGTGQKRYVTIVRFGMIVGSRNKVALVCSVTFGPFGRNDRIVLYRPSEPFRRVRNNVRFGREGRYDVVSTALSTFPPSSGMSELGGFRRHRFLGKIPAATWQYTTHGHDMARAPGEFDPAATCQDTSTGTDREKTDL